MYERVFLCVSVCVCVCLCVYLPRGEGRKNCAVCVHVSALCLCVRMCCVCRVCHVGMHVSAVVMLLPGVFVEECLSAFVCLHVIHFVSLGVFC